MYIDFKHGYNCCFMIKQGGEKEKDESFKT